MRDTSDEQSILRLMQIISHFFQKLYFPEKLNSTEISSSKIEKPFTPIVTKAQNTGINN